MATSTGSGPPGLDARPTTIRARVRSAGCSPRCGLAADDLVVVLSCDMPAIDGRHRCARLVAPWPPTPTPQVAAPVVDGRP